MKPPCLWVLCSHSRVSLHGERLKQAFPTCLAKPSWMFECCWGHDVLMDHISSHHWLSVLRVSSLCASAITQLCLVVCQTRPQRPYKSCTKSSPEGDHPVWAPSGTPIKWPPAKWKLCFEQSQHYEWMPRMLCFFNIITVLISSILCTFCIFFFNI